ncbi:RAB11-binding protein RELCH homolog [Schistocerca nitens]|uniref:RAB11-binding protein RELCH homolog n=1 Tax=Schistocerca nitens TaxID=7011 RepID=UPI002118599C|nr:RAB11-binding protein RELCH homolog [Schistocerca nitens]
MANICGDGLDQDMHMNCVKGNPHNIEISYSDIAVKLLKDNLFLTALELYTELLEAGREVTKLKEFFSNPGNFEQQAYTKPDVVEIRRSSSQVTLDSLDIGRYSEDGERGVDERVAVLEFELRKAKETISALRANLTVATESEANTPEGSSANRQLHNEPIKPHEQRALNFLLNEYLLTYGYKLTSITFSDENENQDFEDWDDVGLNIPKPAELLQLYREFMRQSGQRKVLCQNVACQTDELDLEKESKLQDMAMEVEQLKEQLSLMDQEKQELQRLWTMDSKFAAANVDVSNVTTPGSDLAGILTTSTSHSGTPECFEILDVETKDDCSALQDEDDELPISLTDTDAEWTRVGSTCGAEPAETSSRLQNEMASSSAEAESETKVLLDTSTSRSLPPAFRKEVLVRCFVDTSKQHESQPLLAEIPEKDNLSDYLLPVLGQTLPRVIPNIILNKREEIIPLIVMTIQLHPEADSRDKLLNLLFNLKKKPNEEERLTIIAGMVAIAQCSGPALVETEVLPQCWEQLSHKHIERRLLVVESCSALAPYVSSSIRNSLMLSMLQQMLLEDKEETVRESVVRSLALIILLMDDKDKYFQCEELSMTALDDPAASVVASTTNILFPVLAQWSLDIGRLHTHLLTRLLQRIHIQVKSAPNSPGTAMQKNAEQRLLSPVIVLKTLVPYIVMSVVAVNPVLETLDTQAASSIRSRSFRAGHALTNPTTFLDSKHEIPMVLGAFDAYVDQEWYEEWPELEWIFAQMIPEVLDIVQGMETMRDDIVVGFVKLFRDLCSGFGSSIIRQKVKPCFIERVQNIEVSLTDIRNGNMYPPLAIVPVYIVGVLAPLKDEDLAKVLQRFVCALPTCGAPLTCLEMSVHLLCVGVGGDGGHCRDDVLGALWEAVVHPRAAVRRAAAALFAVTVPAIGEKLVAARVVPALVTLGNDQDLGVRTATIPACGKVITSIAIKEIHAKVYLQLQSIMADAGTRDNHSSLIQLVKTMGSIVTACEPAFRDDVILPQLAGTAAFASQLSNATRRVDLAKALIEAFSSAVSCPLSKQAISTALLPGLRYLEPITNTALYTHHETVMAMIRGAESRLDSQRPIDRSSTLSLAVATANMGQGMEDMKNRVSKIFQNKPTTNRAANIPNLQGIFRKK